MKRLFIACAIALFALAIILSQVVQSTSLEWLRPIIEEELSEAIGLKVQLASSPQLRLTPELEFVVDGVRISNLPGRPSPYMLEVERLTLEPRILPLFRRVLVVDSVELYEATLRIEPDAQGLWAVRPDLDEIDEQENAEPDDPLMLSVRELGIHGLDVFFDRFEGEDVTTIRVDRFLAQSDGRNLPLSFDVEGEFEVAAVTGSFAQLLEPSDPFPLDLQQRLW